LLGYLLGKLTPGDAAQLCNKVLDSWFKFLEAQGPYATFTIFFSSVLVGICFWLVKLLVKAQQGEIDRMAADRDKFQQLIINEWKSTRPGKNTGKGK